MHNVELVFVPSLVAPFVGHRPLRELRDFPWRCGCRNFARGFLVATPPSPTQCEDIVCSRGLFPPSAESCAHVGSRGVIPLEAHASVIPIVEVDQRASLTSRCARVAVDTAPLFIIVVTATLCSVVGAAAPPEGEDGSTVIHFFRFCFQSPFIVRKNIFVRRRLGQNYLVKIIRGPLTREFPLKHLFPGDPSVRGRATTLTGSGQGDIVL